MLSQILINRVQDHSNRRFIPKIQYYAAYIIRQLILQYHDPIVSYKIGQSKLSFPLSSDLPFTICRHPCYATNVARIAKEVHQKYPSMACIDVGAYVGDTVAFLRQEAIFPVLCIEGNKRFYKLLEQNMTIFPDVELVKTYLHSQIDISLETSRDMTTHYHPAYVDSMSLTDVLQRYPRYLQAKMLKIDTDGHDGIILRGAEEFLARVKLILFFEYDPNLLVQHGDDGLSLLSMLHTIGYTMALFYEHIGTYMLSTELENTRLLKELHQWVSWYGGYRYYDICLFHHDDADLGERIRLKETAYFQNSQCPKSF